MITIKATSQMSRAELIAALEQANVGARKQAEAMTELGKLTDMQMKRIAALETALGPVTDAEWGRFNYAFDENALALDEAYLTRASADALIAARLAATEPKP